MDSTENRFLSMLPPTVLEQAHDSVGKLLLREYGAIFVAGNGVEPPDRLIFRDEEEVTSFQSRVNIGTDRFGDITIELQAEAAAALKNAIETARNSGLSITPRS